MKAFTSSTRLALAVLALVAGGVPDASAQPVTEPWPVAAGAEVAGVASAAYGSWTATANTVSDTIEVRDHRGALTTTITRAQLAAQATWMNLGSGPDGPGAIALSASGRILYILLHDDTTPADAQPSDAIVRYDIVRGTFVRLARLELFGDGATAPHLAVEHHGGRLYVGNHAGNIRVYTVGASVNSATLTSTWSFPVAGPVRGISIDRENRTLYACSDSGVWRTAIPASQSSQPTWTQIATSSGLRALAWADHFGGTARRGLYLLRDSAGNGQIDFLTAAQAQGGVVQSPAPYLAFSGPRNDLVATSTGGLLTAGTGLAEVIRDASDTRLTLDGWILDEISQVTDFSKGLIAPDGEPDGWVIDADVIPAWNRFHPATPDGAAWVVMMLIAKDRVLGDAAALPLARQIITRYAGLADDGIGPVRSADGIFKHWIDPFSGNTKAGWPDEYATLSTMKIVLAAARAMQYWPDDPEIARAGSRIIFRVKNWDAYLQAGTDAIAFKGLAGGGPDQSLWSRPFNEGIIFAEQAGQYGGAAAQSSAARWLTRSLWPTGTFLSAFPITTATSGQQDSAFLSIYPALVSQPFRASAEWRSQIEAIRWSNAAWTDDNGPRFSTVFSAGTSSQGGGYNADNLINHPDNFTTFPSLMGLAAFGAEGQVLGAYHAYRKGARQTFKGGASILYRQSDSNRAFLTNSAGLPDVVLGGLALAGLVEPGLVDELLATPYPTVELCPVDLDADGEIDAEDLYRAEQTASDFNADGLVSARDLACFRAWVRRDEASRSATP